MSSVRWRQTWWNWLSNWLKFFHINLISYICTKTAFWSGCGTDTIIMSKILVLQHLRCLSDFALKKQIIDWIFLEKFLDFPEYTSDGTTVWPFIKRITGKCEEKEIWGQLKSQLKYLGFENKKEINSELYFIDSDLGYEKSDKPRVMKRKQERERRNLDKKPDEPYFSTNFIA